VNRRVPYENVSNPEQLREEIRRRDRKLAALRRECRDLRTAAGETRHRELRRENRRLRRALSFIAYAPDAGEDPAFLKHVAGAALLGADPAGAPQLTRARS
jgi:hypothetical protein